MIKILQILGVKSLDDSNTVKLKPMFNYNNVYRAKDYDDTNLQVLTRAFITAI
ncbi:hypothetical protein [Histophilus somni]|uniref:hypothetical protein n=1 Tax=Histophilus somni TaxID=731 RepID=UPI000A8FD6E2|nr:hypothetical protein [Histophilus somni]